MIKCDLIDCRLIGLNVEPMQPMVEGLHGQSAKERPQGCFKCDGQMIECCCLIECDLIDCRLMISAVVSDAAGDRLVAISDDHGLMISPVES